MSDQIKVTTKDLFKIRDFRLLWTGQVISNFGDNMTNLALLLLVNALTGSTAALATMAIVLAVPSLTFGLVSGVYVDRLDRKKIMIFSDLLRGVFVLGFILVDSPEKIWLLYLIGFIQASIGTFFRPARSALLPNIVTKEGLLAANSISETSRIIFGLLGTGAAGFLAGTLDNYVLVFGTDALTFFVSLGLISMIAYRQPAAEVKEAISLQKIRSDLATGLRVTFSNRVLGGAITAFSMVMLGLGAVNILLVPLVVNELQIPETWFAALEFSQTSAMILAGSVVAVLAARFKPTRILPIALFLLGFIIGLFYLPTAVWHLLVLLFFAGLCITPIQASGQTIIQTAVPDNLRGRTGAASNALISTANLISMGAAGLLADALGVRVVFVLGGLLVAASGVVAALMFKGFSLSQVEEPLPVVENM